jgi:ribonuclease J
LRDGNLTIEEAARTVADRRKLGFAGVISVALAIGGRGDLAGDPWIEMTGIPEFVAPDRTMREIVADAVENAVASLPKARRREPDAVTQAVERSVRGAVNSVWGKKPWCHVLVVQV